MVSRLASGAHTRRAVTLVVSRRPAIRAGCVGFTGSFLVVGGAASSAMGSRAFASNVRLAAALCVGVMERTVSAV